MYLLHMVEKIKLDSKRNLKEKLLLLCDDDYSGRNGQEYFYNYNVSYFDRQWDKVNHLSDPEIITSIIHDNYSNPYYKKHNLIITETDTELIVSISAIY